MQANRHEAFGGRVVFCTRPTSVESGVIWKRFEEIYDTLEHPIKAALEGDGGMGYLISHTTAIEFHFQGNETELMNEFRDLWPRWEKFDTDGVKVALDWRMRAPNALIEAWVEALETRDLLWIDPTIAPLDLLTPEQQKEAADPESPLPSPAKQSGKKTLQESAISG